MSILASVGKNRTYKRPFSLSERLRFYWDVCWDHSCMQLSNFLIPRVPCRSIVPSPRLLASRRAWFFLPRSCLPPVVFQNLIRPRKQTRCSPIVCQSATLSLSLSVNPRCPNLLLAWGWMMPNDSRGFPPIGIHLIRWCLQTTPTQIWQHLCPFTASVAQTLLVVQPYQQCELQWGEGISWSNSLEDVPQVCSFFQK